MLAFATWAKSCLVLGWLSTSFKNSWFKLFWFRSFCLESWAIIICLTEVLLRSEEDGLLFAWTDLPLNCARWISFILSFSVVIAYVLEGSAALTCLLKFFKALLYLAAELYVFANSTMVYNCLELLNSRVSVDYLIEVGTFLGKGVPVLWVSYRRILTL